MNLGHLLLKILVGLVALLLLYLGLGLVFDPLEGVRAFAVEPQGLHGLSTIRGDLGGMFIASTIMLSIGLATGASLWYMAVAVLMGAIAAGRVVGFVVDGYDDASLAPFIVELVMVAVLVTARVVLRHHHHESGHRHGEH
ncbi:MAG: DUF4345 family protein [Pseudomonadales bacterium]